MPKSLRQAAREAKASNPEPTLEKESRAPTMVTVTALKEFFWGNAKTEIGEQISVSHSVKELLVKKGLV